MQRLKARRRLRAGDDDGDAADRAARSAQFVVFRLGEDEFGLPIEAVNEVARVPDQITRLPKTPKFLEGVVNLRGDVLPVVDQRRRFDMPPLEEQGARRLVVVRTERHRAGLIVDRVSGGAALLRPTTIEPAPEPDQRSRAPRPGRDQSREGGPHRAAARSRRTADARRARPARRVPGQGGAGACCDQGPGRRRLRRSCESCWARSSRPKPTSRSSSRATGWKRSTLLDAFKPDVVTLDIHMPQMDGLACLDRIMVEHPCPVVMVSSLTAEGAEATLRGPAPGRGRLRRQARRARSRFTSTS